MAAHGTTTKKIQGLDAPNDRPEPACLCGYSRIRGLILQGVAPRRHRSLGAGGMLAGSNEEVENGKMMTQIQRWAIAELEQD